MCRHSQGMRAAGLGAEAVGWVGVASRGAVGGPAVVPVIGATLPGPPRWIGLQRMCATKSVLQMLHAASGSETGGSTVPMCLADMLW